MSVMGMERRRTELSYHDYLQDTPIFLNLAQADQPWSYNFHARLPESTPTPIEMQ